VTRETGRHAEIQTSEAQSSLFSSSQRAQIHHAVGDIKDPTGHHAVVYVRLHLLTQVAEFVLNRRVLLANNTWHTTHQSLAGVPRGVKGEGIKRDWMLQR
jgi:hypothetical protein